MTAFIAIAAALVALTMALLTRRLWWPFGAAGRTNEAQELVLQLRKLRELHRAGVLDVEQHERSKALVERKLLDSLSDPAAPATPEKPSPALAGGLASFILVVACGGYLWLGSPGDLGLGPGSGGTSAARADDGAAAEGQGASAPHALQPEQISAMVDQLAERLKSQPDDAEGWLMLARSQVALGKHAEAVDAYRQAARLRPDDANLFADYADALAMKQGRKLDGEPTGLIERALKIDPANPKALALAGTAAFDRRDYAGAVKYWDRLVQTEPGDTGFAQQIRASLAEARQLGGMPPAVAPLPGEASSAPARARVSGTVELASNLKDRVSPDDTLFVFARAVEGPRMPLAILRKRVRDLPLSFTLDDELAMSADAKLSSASRVVVGARISKSGNAMPQNGDLQGQLSDVAVGSSGLKVVVNQEVTR